jgi:hemolysin activation/secretion protein
LKVYVRHIRLTGNTVFPEQELQYLTAPYENREVTSEELQTLRHALTRYYVDRGYINSGAIIPDQEVKDGIIELRIIEGRLSHIELEGNKGLRTGYLNDRIALGAGPPLNINTLQERIQILLENPLIERINAEIQPGGQPGEAVLKASVEEKSPYQLGLSFDNHIAPSIGGLQGRLYGGHQNLTGWGDRLGFEFGYAEGLTDYSVDYSLPLTRRDTTAQLWYNRSDSNVVEDPFNIIDVESEYRAYGLTLSHPVYRTPQQSFSLSASIERRHSLTLLDGNPFCFFCQGFPNPFAFSEDSRNGESDITVLRLSQEWIDRTPDQVIAARSTFSIGIDAFGAMDNPGDLPDGEFFTWLGQFQWVRRLGPGEIVFRTDLQLAKDPLLPLEKLSVGGANSVRGYRENELVRDWGFVSSIEYRYTVYQSESGEHRLQIAPFVDVGGAWDIDKDTPNPEIIPSAGVGLRWNPFQKLYAEFYWGYAFESVDNPSSDLQDHGIHFQLVGELF